MSKYKWVGPIAVPDPVDDEDAANKGFVLANVSGGAPAAHAASHSSGGSDPVTPADIGAATTGALSTGLAGKASTTHAATHASGSSDPVSPASIGAAATTDTRLSVKPYPPVTLADTSTIATDATLGTHFRVTPSLSRTLGTPTGGVDGQVCTWEIINGAGAKTITLSGGFSVSTSITGGITATAANTRDFIQAVYSSSLGEWLVIGYAKGLA